ncbi:MAG: deoxynucleoside kinase [Rhodothermales bacterium]
MPLPSPPDWLQYIAVEGVIGVGKTSLVRLLAERLNGQTVLEQFEENPFLERFYEDAERWAFQTQLTFLASRFRQQQALSTRDLFHNALVSDYAFEKDRIFAHVTLKGDELHLYETMYTIMEPTVPRPDLVIYLRSSVERLLANIRKRARSYEAEIDPNYLAELGQAYDYFFQRYTRSPLLIVQSTEIDFIGNPEHQAGMLQAIFAHPGHGTVTYSPQPTAQLNL